MTKKIFEARSVIKRSPERDVLPPMSAADLRDDVINHIGPMRAYAFALTLDRAEGENLVAAALMDAWQKTDAIGPETKIRTWLFTVLHDRFHAAQQNSDSVAVDEDSRVHVASRPQSGNMIASEAFRRAFGSLSVFQREALVLTGPERLSCADAAAVCGCSNSVLKYRANDGRRRLAALFPSASDAPTVALRTTNARITPTLIS